MNIVMTLPSFAIGGMERFQLALAGALIGRGHRVHVVSLHGEGTLREAFAEAGASNARVRESRGGIVHLLRPARLARELVEFSADVVHSVSGVWLPSVRAAAMVPRVAAVHVQHGLEARRGWRVAAALRLAARETHSVVAVSEEVLRETTEIAGVPPDRISIIPNGLPLPAHARDHVIRDARQGWGLPRSAFVIGCLARFDAVKNLPLLVRAVAAVHERAPELDTHLVLAGDGAEAPAIRAEVQRAGIADRVHLPGMVSDPLRLLEVLDVCALVSRTEGTPMSLIEAMAVGVPIVATAVGGIPALLCAGEAGLLVPAGDERAASDALLAVARDSEAAARRAAVARRLTVERYEIGAVAERYLEIYEHARRVRAGRDTR